MAAAVPASAPPEVLKRLIHLHRRKHKANFEGCRICLRFADGVAIVGCVCVRINPRQADFLWQSGHIWLVADSDFHGYVSIIKRIDI